MHLMSHLLSPREELGQIRVLDVGSRDVKSSQVGRHVLGCGGHRQELFTNVQYPESKFRSVHNRLRAKDEKEKSELAP